MPRPPRRSRSRSAIARRRLTALASVVALVAVIDVASASSTVAVGPCGATGVLSGTSPMTCTYTTVGSDTFTVPSGVTQGSFTVVGAQGGHYFISGAAANGCAAVSDITGRPGGGGGEAAATLALTPGAQIQVDVAGAGVNGTAAKRCGGMMNGPSGGAGGLGGFGGSNGGVAGAPGDASGANGGTAFNGGNGSGAGGSSDIRVDPSGCASLTCGLADRTLVAAGGGGGGGVGGQGNALGGAGGDGGGTTGANGGTTVDGGGAGVSGTGATPTSGGTGGLEPGLHSPGADPTDPRYGGDGANGSSGSGGVGGVGNFPCTDPNRGGQCAVGANTSGGGAGGGAGGGRFGGGGGSGGGSTFGGGGGDGGGGGGGSSYADPGAGNVAITSGANQGTINGGNGEVTVTWTPAAQATPTIAIQVAPTGQLGGEISATSTLAGGSSPTGAVTFMLYGPGDLTCVTPVATFVETVTGDGTYSSGSFSPTTAGTYRFVARYSGDGGNAAASTACGDASSSIAVSGPPTVTTGAASGVTDTTAGLAGTVTPNGVDTKAVFEFGTTLSFGSITSVADAGSGASPVTFTGSLAGLSPATTYYYRVVATSANGTAFGTVASFTTTGPAATPVVVTQAPVAVANTSAVVAGTVNPSRQATAYTVEYGTSTTFGSIAPVVELDSGNSPEAVTSTLSGLSTNTTYLYRVVASNATGTSTGAVMSFTTGPTAAPVVVSGAATSVSSTSEKLNGRVDPQASPTSFAFEYGTTTNFGSLSAVDNAGSGFGSQSVSLTITGLTPGQTYLYRIVASNANGSATGIVKSFVAGP